MILYPYEFCGRCRSCLAGDQPLCHSARILGEHRHGTFAEEVVLPGRSLIRLAPDTDMDQAAVLGVAYLTAWRMVFGKAPAGPGSVVLVQGAGGGVAYAAMQRARMAGARVIVTTSGATKIRHFRALGVEVIDYRAEDVPKAVLRLTDGEELKGKTFAEVYEKQLITATWEGLMRVRKPTIAAVLGHAIGGGCEIALMCDILFASETTRFALPETAIGVIPGGGDAQRLTRIVGKAVAMDMILTGRALNATEALAMGLVSRVVPAGQQLAVTTEIAAQVASRSRPVLQLAKEAVLKACETHLQERLYVERRLLYATFALEDRCEGMTAFSEKRAPRFRHR